MIKLKTIFVRKPMDYKHLLYEQKELMCNFNATIEEFKIDTVVELSHNEFENLKSNLLADRNFCKENNGIFLVKEQGTDDYSGFIVDAQGFSYPRYVGIPMQESEIKKCPRCSKYYIEPPAISRKDNKTEICPACGVEEAFKAIGIDRDFLDFLSNVQSASDKYKIRVTVEQPGKDDIVITPYEE